MVPSEPPPRGRVKSPPSAGRSPPAEHLHKYLPLYTRAGLIMNQGQEGACTGFGLACVVNYLRWRRFGLPTKMTSVSPRMLYNFARRYDDYAGEDYNGSSCRGALKGWFRRVRRYLTEDESSRMLMHQAAGLPDRWFRATAGTAKKRLVIYAHGGLNSEKDAIERARAMGRSFTGNGCYPLFLLWNTGLLESIANIFSEFGRQPPPRPAGVGEWFTEQSDALIEKTIGRGLARPVWSEMKENAELTCSSGRGGALLACALQKLASTWGDDFELHLVGHSAGSIILGNLLTPLAACGKYLIRQRGTSGPAMSVAQQTRQGGMIKLCVT